MTLSIVVHDTTEVVDLVESGEVQIGMTGARIPGARVDYEPMGTDKLLLVCPVSHPLASEKGVSLERLTEEPFVVREQGSGTRLVFEHALREGGIEPNDLRVVLELATARRS